MKSSKEIYEGILDTNNDDLDQFTEQTLISNYEKLFKQYYLGQTPYDIYLKDKKPVIDFSSKRIGTVDLSDLYIYNDDLNDFTFIFPQNMDYLIIKGSGIKRNNLVLSQVTGYNISHMKLIVECSYNFNPKEICSINTIDDLMIDCENTSSIVVPGGLKCRFLNIKHAKKVQFLASYCNFEELHITK